jgi:hypothetical protein
MLVKVGKGIEIEVDVNRLNSTVMDHVVYTGLRNLLRDAHAGATARMIQRAMSQSHASWSNGSSTDCIEGKFGELEVAWLCQLIPCRSKSAGLPRAS